MAASPWPAMTRASGFDRRTAPLTTGALSTVSGLCHDGLDLDVLLDDADPYRSCHEVAVAEPLSGADVAHWQAMTASTWHLLVARHRMRAEALAYGLRAITPLLSGRHRPGREHHHAVRVLGHRAHPAESRGSLRLWADP